jgi:hypothetical protein
MRWGGERVVPSQHQQDKGVGVCERENGHKKA